MAKRKAHKLTMATITIRRLARLNRIVHEAKKIVEFYHEVNWRYFGHEVDMGPLEDAIVLLRKRDG